MDENIVFPSLRDSEDALWSLLVFSGYLKATPGPVEIGRPRPPQQLSIPNGLMTGLLASLEPDYEVRSNRESGQGRPDVWIKPRRPGKPGVILELKAAAKHEGKKREGNRDKTLDEALEEGLDQIVSKKYEAELRAAGVDAVHAYSVAFDGKEVRVRSTEGWKKKAARGRGGKKPAGRR